MTLQVILCALATAVRPTSLAAVYAILASAAPRRLMTAYVVAGLAVTVSFGLLVVWVFKGISVGGSSTEKAIAQIAGGGLAMTLGVLMLRGRVRLPETRRAKAAASAGEGTDQSAGADQGGSWHNLRGRRFTLRTAAVAGPATHVPGLFYLIALNIIVASGPAWTRGLFEVGLYNLIWFALPIAALALCIVWPDGAMTAVSAVENWARSNTQTLVAGAALGIGVLLIVQGVISL